MQRSVQGRSIHTANYTLTPMYRAEIAATSENERYFVSVHLRPVSVVVTTKDGNKYSLTLDSAD